MSLVWFDGFDPYDDTGGPFGDDEFLTSAFYLEVRGVNLEKSTASDPNGSEGYLSFDNTQSNNGTDVGEWIGKYIGENKQTITTGFYWQFNDPTVSEDLILCEFHYNDGATTTRQVAVFLNSNLGFTAKRGTTTLDTSDDSLVQEDTWYYIEVQVKIDDTAGYVIVRLDDGEVIRIEDVDTQNVAGASSANVVRLSSKTRAGGSNGQLVSDWYICDELGPINNDFLSDRFFVQMQTPILNGDITQWTPVGERYNYECIDDSPRPDYDTTYVFSNTTGAKDLYLMDTIPNHTGDVYGAIIMALGRREAAGDLKLKFIYRQGGIDITSTSVTFQQSYSWRHALLETKPATGIWFPEPTRNTQIGFEIST